MLGLRAGRVLWWPVAFFYFALPIWDALNPVLQAATVHANRVLALFFGVPVIIDGTLIHIPAGSFEIAGGCSGLNYLVVGLAVAALLGELNGDSPRRRLYLVALSGGLALVSNWVRVFIIIYAGHVTDMTHYLVRVDHYKWGWVLYAFVLALFFYLARRMPVSASPSQGEFANSAVGGQVRLAPVAAACVAVAIGPVLTGWRQANIAGDVRVQEELPRLVADGREMQWLASPSIGGWLPEFPGADAEQLVDYSYGDAHVAVYIATYVLQSQGRELVGHDSRLQGRHSGRFVPGAGSVASTESEIAMREGEWRDSAGGHALYWWIYQVGERRFTSGLRAQLWYGVSSLWSAPHSSIVVLRSECLPNCGHARMVLKRFAGAAMPGLLASIGDGSDSARTRQERSP
jgi:exosortase/archaeosortase family protein